MWVFGYLFLDNHIIKTVNLLICKTGTGCESLKAAQGGRGDRERWGHMARRMGRPRNVGKAMLRGWRSYGIKGISVLETKVPECKG